MRTLWSRQNKRAPGRNEKGKYLLAGLYRVFCAGAISKNHGSGCSGMEHTNTDVRTIEKVREQTKMNTATLSKRARAIIDAPETPTDIRTKVIAIVSEIARADFHPPAYRPAECLRIGRLITAIEFHLSTQAPEGLRNDT